MIAKLRVVALFILANAMGSLTMILPAAPADRDQGGEIFAPAQTFSRAGGAGHDGNSRGEESDPSLLINHDVFYASCPGASDCGGDQAERDHSLRPDLINAAPPSGLFPFAGGGGGDGGQSHGASQSNHDATTGTAPFGSAPFGSLPSALFPFLPGAPFLGAPGGENVTGGPGAGGPGVGGPGVGGPGAGGPGAGGASPDYPGLGAGAGAPAGAPGSSGDWQPIAISSISGAPPSADEQVPEPATLPLLATGALALVMIRRQRKRATR